MQGWWGLGRAGCSEESRGVHVRPSSPPPGFDLRQFTVSISLSFLPGEMGSACLSVRVDTWDHAGSGVGLTSHDSKMPRVGELETRYAGFPVCLRTMRTSSRPFLLCPWSLASSWPLCQAKTAYLFLAAVTLGDWHSGAGATGEVLLGWVSQFPETWVSDSHALVCGTCDQSAYSLGQSCTFTPASTVVSCRREGRGEINLGTLH